MISPRCSMSYVEIEHLSDRAFRVTGQTLEELFQQAAEAMYSVMSVLVFGAGPNRQIFLSGPDAESMLVMFLSELLLIAEVENLAVHTSSIHIDDRSLRAELTLSPILRKVENVKAVTFSQMNIISSESGFETDVVFDI